MLKKSYLCKAISVAKFCGIKESALHSLKSPISKSINKARSSSYTWAAYPCVYTSVWRCSRVAWMAAHFLYL